jgi:hypothetical protein
MSIAMACPAASTRTRPAADPATPADRMVWQAFINRSDIDEWIRATFHQQWHWPESKKVDEKYDSVVNTAWFKLRGCTTYRCHKGTPEAFACSVIAKAPRAERGRERRWRRKMRSADAMREDPRQDQTWQRDQDEPERVARERMRDDVREALPFATGEPRQWAEMFLCICEEHDSPVDLYDRRRPDPQAETQRRLGWSRYACDQARACLVRDRHVARLAALRPTP